MIIIIIYLAILFQFQCEYVSSQFFMMMPNSPDPYLAIPDLIDGAPFSFMRDLGELLLGV
jgi:hypothetical protein